MIKKYLLLLGVLTCTTLAYAQQDPNFTIGQYHNLSYQNPAVLGSHDAYCATMVGRLQWAGWEGAPSTFLFSAEGPLHFKGGDHGLGLTIMSDALGNESTTVIKFGYNYKFTNLFAGGDLRVGLGIGYISKTLGKDWKAIDGTIFDPNIPVNGASEGGLDLDFGAFYKIPNKLAIGISSTHLTANNFNQQLSDQIGGNTGQFRQFKYQIDRTIYVSAQYQTQVIDANWVLKPGVFIKSDLAATSINLGALMEYQQKFWGGLDYRLQDAVSLMMGANFQMNGTNATGGVLKVGYSYDFTTSAIRRHSGGSHEIFARYCFNLNAAPPRVEHRDVRFL